MATVLPANPTKSGVQGVVSGGPALDSSKPIAAAVSIPAFDRPDFNTVDFINRIFPNEGSLAAVDPLIQKLRNKIRRVDAEILAAVRVQSTSGSKAKEDLASAMKAIQELVVKIKEIKAKAEQSELMVQEICRDIKKLDFAKKHITTTITALHRLAMLVSAVDQLQVMAAKRQYREAAGQLEAVNQLISHFEKYSEVPKIAELRDKFINIKQTLRSHIFSDFSSIHSQPLKENPQLQQQLADACLAVDALDPAVKEELIRTICGKELTAYQQIFQGTVEVAKLEKAERRYSWIKRELRAKEDMWAIFPPAWRVPYLLCMQFSKVTRAQLAEILDAAREKPDVAVLLQALQRTLEFEEELAERFRDGKDSGARDLSDDEGEEEGRRKRGGARADEGESEEGAADDDNSRARSPLAAVAPTRFSFHGIISSAFEPHMGVYVDLEEKTLMETMEKLIQEETWEAESGSQSNVLSSSTQVFLHIKKSLKRCTALTRSQTLFNLYKVFQRVLKAYAGKLSQRLPRAGSGLMAAATGTEWQVKVSERDERVICFIINTAEYCTETAGQLGESISKVIDPQFAEQIDMSEVEDECSGVLTRALSILVLGLETRIDAELVGMTRVTWGTIEAVGDQSEYVNGVSGILSTSVPTVSSLLSELHFQYFMDKLAASFAPRFYFNIFKCKRISEMGAQQMLLDTHAIKTVLLELPSLGGQSNVPSSYSKYVTKEFGKAEALLKVILSPVEALADTYRTLLPEGNTADFSRILELKGLKKAEQQPLLDAYSGRRPVLITPASQSPTPSAAPGPSTAPAPVLTTSTSAVSTAAAASALAGATRATAMERAVALGRGAMVQSAAAAAAMSSTRENLKRIFNMSESSRPAEKKEGTFRKLFQS